jgi:hypothetical protein
VREILDGLLDVVFRDVLSSAMARGRAHLSKRESFFSSLRLSLVTFCEVKQRGNNNGRK